METDENFTCAFCGCKDCPQWMYGGQSEDGEPICDHCADKTREYYRDVQEHHKEED